MHGGLDEIVVDDPAVLGETLNPNRIGNDRPDPRHLTGGQLGLDDEAALDGGGRVVIPDEVVAAIGDLDDVSVSIIVNVPLPYPVIGIQND